MTVLDTMPPHCAPWNSVRMLVSIISSLHRPTIWDGSSQLSAWSLKIPGTLGTVKFTADPKARATPCKDLAAKTCPYREFSVPNRMLRPRPNRLPACDEREARESYGQNRTLHVFRHSRCPARMRGNSTHPSIPNRSSHPSEEGCVADKRSGMRR
jgi:hypothetical protein